MSDQAVDLEATDAFALGGSFVAQNSSFTSNQEWARMTGADGLFLKWSNEFNQVTEVTCTYRFNAISGLPTALPWLGSVSNALLITEISVASVHNDWPTITITGHNHGENAHINDRNKWDVSSFFATATGAFGAYDVAGKAAGETCATSSTITASMNHVDAECSNGNHWVGQNIQGQVSATVEYIGPISGTVAVSGWNTSSWNNSDANEGFDTSSITIEAPIHGTISEDPA